MSIYRTDPKVRSKPADNILTLLSRRMNRPSVMAGGCVTRGADRAPRAGLFQGTRERISL